MEFLTETLSILAVVGLMIWGMSRQWTQGHRASKLWQEAVDAFAAHDIKTAERALRACVKLVPTAAPAHRFLGRVLLERNKLKEAEERIRFGAELEPRNADGHLDLAQFYLTIPTPRDSDALDALEQAIACAPGLRAEVAQHPLFARLSTNPRFRQLTAQEGAEPE